MKPPQVADTDVAKGVAVICQVERKVFGFLGPRLPALAPVLKCHLQCDFDRRRTIVGKENVAQAGRRNLDQAASKLDSRDIGNAKQSRVCHGVELRANGGVEFRHSMAMYVAPQRGNAIQVFTTVEVDEKTAMGPLDDERWFLRVGLHRRKRV